MPNQESYEETCILAPCDGLSRVTIELHGTQAVRKDLLMEVKNVENMFKWMLNS